MCIDKKFVCFGLAGIFAMNAIMHFIMVVLGWTIIIPEIGFIFRGITNFYISVMSLMLSYLFYKLYEGKPVKARVKKRR